MVSVPSDISASTSFPVPSPRAKADPQPQNDSFAALVDSNAAAANDNSDRAQDRLQQDRADAAPGSQPSANRRPAPARRDDPPAADRASARETKRADAGRSDPKDSDAAADQANDASTETGAPKRAETKATAGKGDESKAADKPADTTDSGDAAETQAASDQTGTDPADAIAAAIAAAVVVPDAPPPVAPAVAANPVKADGGDAGPLAIAAAAIAASNAVTEGKTAPAVPQVAVDAVAKTAAEHAKGMAAQFGTTQQEGTAGAETEPALANNAALTAAVARPATTKTAAAQKSGAPTIADGTAATPDADSRPTTTDSAATNPAGTAPAGTEQQPAADAKPAAKPAHPETAKTDAAGTPAPSPAHLNVSAGHEASANPVHAQTGAAAGGVAVQPLMQATVPAAPASFTVTAAAPSAPVPISGLALEIAASVRSGKSRFEIRLDPADLGRIDVRIDVDRNGQVTSHLTVEKAETLSMLRQDAPQLQRALNDAGLSTGNSGLQFSLRDQSSSGQNGNQSNPNAQRLILTEEEAVPAAVVGNYGRMLSGNGGVDIRV